MMKKEKNIMIVLSAFNTGLPLIVNGIKDGLLEVMQGKNVVFMADKLCMRHVIFYSSVDKHYIMGIVCKPSDVGGVLKDDNDYNDYACVYYNGENYVEKTTGLSVFNSDWCDLDVNSSDEIMAIWNQEVPRELP